MKIISKLLNINHLTMFFFCKLKIPWEPCYIEKKRLTSLNIVSCFSIPIAIGIAAPYSKITTPIPLYEVAYLYKANKGNKSWLIKWKQILTAYCCGYEAGRLRRAVDFVQQEERTSDGIKKIKKYLNLYSFCWVCVKNLNN